MSEVIPEIVSVPVPVPVKIELPASKLTVDEANKQFPGPSEFVSLHNHSLFSALDGIASPDDYFKECAARKWPAIAITEHGVLNSIPDAYLASKVNKVKQIVGVEFYFCEQEPKRQKMEKSEEIKKKYAKVHDIWDNWQRFTKRAYKSPRHLTVLAKDEQGYSNLLKINKESWADFFYRKPRVNISLLEKYHEGLIVLSGCMNGPISYELRSDNMDMVKDKGLEIVGARYYMRRLKEIFKEDFYVELQMPGVKNITNEFDQVVMDDVTLFQKLLSIAQEFSVKTVLTLDTHYMARRDQELQKVLMAIDQNVMIDDPKLFFTDSNEQYLKTRAELRATFKLNGFEDKIPISYFEEACNNTLEIASKCSQFKPDLEPKLPKIPNADEELRRRAHEGLIAKGLDKDQTKFMMDEKLVTYSEQLEIELKRIIEKGFASYFLITLKLIETSLKLGYPVGPRGSVGGSLLSYVIGIQTLNPMLFKLSFNRFLSPTRGGWMLNLKME